MTTQSLPNLSFEFFPPQTEVGQQNLQNTCLRLGELQPDFFSVTFGAAGSTSTNTPETVFAIKKSVEIATVPHISCTGVQPSDIADLLERYKMNGIDRLVVLRGDRAPGTGEQRGELRYASDLVRFIRERTGDHFHISVAAYPEPHPESANAAADLENFKCKVDMGANTAITQYFYNPDAYFSFVERCHHHHIDIPIIPGIMPITNLERLLSFSEKCGANIPKWLREGLAAYGDDVESMQAYGREVVIKLCQTLLQGGAPGLHFFTLNRAEPTRTICECL